MKNINRLIVLGVVLITTGSALMPVTNVFAAEASPTYSSVQSNSEFNKYFNDLSDAKKAEFQSLIEGANLSQDEQLKILKEKYNSDREIMPRWKGAIVRKVAKWLAAKVGERTVSDVTNYLFEWQDNLEQGAENYLVNHGWNRTAAHWTVKTASFIFL